VAERPGQAYNPLILCGRHGVGKTHLLQAVARALQVRHPDFAPHLTSGEDFANAYLAALRDRKLDSFRQQHRRCHALLLDDLQFLAGKEKTQDEFLHTFAALFHAGRQIVLACQLPPREIAGLDGRIVERCQSGLLARLDPPAHETRVKLVLAKAHHRGLVFSREVAEILALRIERSVRELEGAVCKLGALAAAEERAPDKAMAQAALRDLGYLREGPPALDEILAAVASFYRQSPDDLRSANRLASVVHARHVAMYLCKRLTTHSLSEIGRFYGHRDHSTVMHAVQKIETLLERDERLKSEAQSIRRALGQ
jgi:chromosomal replication initiator protein